MIQQNVEIGQNILFDCCIARHYDKDSYWLITHQDNTNTFLSYLINKEGINIKPIKSTIGIVTVQEKWTLFAKHYFFKSSIKGDKILLNQLGTEVSASQAFSFQVFNFNNKKGIFESTENITLKSHNKQMSLFGQEFSPNGRYIYSGFVERDAPYGTIAERIKQYDIITQKEVGNIPLYLEGNRNMGGRQQVIQLATDGNIYTDRSSFSNMKPVSNIFFIKTPNLLFNNNLKKLEKQHVSWFGRMPNINHLLPLSLGKDENTLVVDKPFTRPILFETNQSTLKPEYENDLKDVLEFLVKNTTAIIEISGHTDNEGEEKNNKILSENRAKSVANFLIKNKIEPSRIKAIGYGSAKPLVANDTPENKAKNRRIEFLISEKK